MKLHTTAFAAILALAGLGAAGAQSGANADREAAAIDRPQGTITRERLESRNQVRNPGNAGDTERARLQKRERLRQHKADRPRGGRTGGGGGPGKSGGGRY